MTRKGPSSPQVVTTMVDVFGWRRASELLGMFAIAGATGVEPDRGAFLAAGHIGSKATRYRAMADLEKFVAELAVRGLLAEAENGPGAALVKLGRTRGLRAV